MSVVFDGTVRVGYGQFYVESGELDARDLLLARSGQRNGLCGAAEAGLLSLKSGLHTGRVRVQVQVLTGRPPLAQEWEEVVEASFHPAGPRTRLQGYDERLSHEIPLAQIDHRVRYCVTGMEAARQTSPYDDPSPDRYLLQVWPAPPAPDEVVRVSGREAARWHEDARTRPPATPLRERDRAAVAAYLARRGSRPVPGRNGPVDPDRVGEAYRARGAADGLGLARLDHALAVGLAALPDLQARLVARWSARRAAEEAGLTVIPWIRRALDELDVTGTLPTPLDDLGILRTRVLAEPGVPITTVRSYDGRSDGIRQQDAALPAMLAPAVPDAMAAATTALLDAVVTFGVGYPRLLADVRSAFPSLTG